MGERVKAGDRLIMGSIVQACGRAGRRGGRRAPRAWQRATHHRHLGPIQARMGACRAERRVASPRAGNSRAWTRRSPDRTTRLPRQPGHRRRRSSPRRFPTRPAARATHRSGRPTNTLTRLGRTERGSSAHYPARFVYRGNARVTISTRAIGTRWRSSVTTLSGSPGNARAPVPGGCPRSNRSGSAPTCIRQGISTE